MVDWKKKLDRVFPGSVIVLSFILTITCIIGAVQVRQDGNDQLNHGWSLYLNTTKTVARCEPLVRAMLDAEFCSEAYRREVAIQQINVMPLCQTEQIIPIRTKILRCELRHPDFEVAPIFYVFEVSAIIGGCIFIGVVGYEIMKRYWWAARESSSASSEMQSGEMTPIETETPPPERAIGSYQPVSQEAVLPRREPKIDE